MNRRILMIFNFLTPPGDGFRSTVDTNSEVEVKRDMEEEKDKNNGMGPLAKSSMRAAKVNI